MSANSTPPCSTSSPTPKEKKEEESSQIDPDEGVVLQDTSTDMEEQQAVPPPPANASTKQISKAEPTKAFLTDIADSFQAFYEKQKSVPLKGSSKPISTVQSRDKKKDQSLVGSANSKRVIRSTSTPKPPLPRDRGKKPLPPKSPSEARKSKVKGQNPERGRRPKDMDLDSVLDFDTKRLGEPDGAESGVVMDMEGSLPVFSDSGDLTPEPTRITPRGKINKPKKPKATPRGMAL